MKSDAVPSLPRAARVARPLAIAALTLGFGGIALGVLDWAAGVEEWRPGSRASGIILTGAMTANILAMWILGHFERPPSYAVSRGRSAAGYTLLALGVVLLVIRILRE